MRRAGAAGEGADVGVILLCRDEARNLRACLEAVLGQGIDARVDVLVIDSGSSDGSVGIARSLPVRLLEIPSRGFNFAAARNLGGRACEAPVLVHLGADALPLAPDWLERLVAPLGGEVVGSYGRQVARPGARPMERFQIEELYGPRPRLQRRAEGRPPGRRETFFSTVNCALRRSAWEEHPFCEELNHSEDQEWSRHWLERGAALAYVPGAAVLHSHDWSLGAVFRRSFDSGAASGRSWLAPGRAATARFALEGAGYLMREAAWLVRTGQLRWLPYAAVYEGLKSLGLALGRHRDRLPRRLARRLAYYR